MTHPEDQIHTKIEAITKTLVEAHKIARGVDSQRDTDIRHLLSIAIQDLNYLKREV